MESYSIVLILLIFVLYKNGTAPICVFLVWLFPLNIMSVRFITPAADGCTLFILIIT